MDSKISEKLKKGEIGIVDAIEEIEKELQKIKDEMKKCKCKKQEVKSFSKSKSTKK